jgi:hypothetical protein
VGAGAEKVVRQKRRLLKARSALGRCGRGGARDRHGDQHFALRARLDRRRYPIGKNIAKKELRELRIERAYVARAGGCTYGPAFLPKLAIDKCADATPIYRIEKAMRRAGIPISRSTMNDLVFVAADVCELLWRAALAEVRVDAHVQADETSVRTQTRKERSFVWTFLSSTRAVTFSMRWRPRPRRAPEGIEAQSPDESLCNLFDLDPDGFLERLVAQASPMKRPPVTFEDLPAGMRPRVRAAGGGMRGYGKKKAAARGGR